MSNLTIVHSTVEIDEVTSNESDEVSVRVFESNWEAPANEAALYRAVGEWIAERRKEIGYRFVVHSVIGDFNRVTVMYRVHPDPKAGEAMTPDVTADAA